MPLVFTNGVTMGFRVSLRVLLQYESFPILPVTYLDVDATDIFGAAGTSALANRKDSRSSPESPTSMPWY